MGIFAKNIRYLRIQNGLSQDALAKAINMNRGNIASYETGTAEPNYHNLINLSRFFKVDVSEMIEDDMAANGEMYHQLKDFGQKEAVDPLEDELMEKQFEEKLIENQDMLDHFRRRSDDMARILDGFRQFHKFKMETSEEISEDVKKMAADYEKLMDVLEDVLKTNRNLLDILGVKDAPSN
jgi:transcriptional regulator with XRE-family HTH domain